MNGTSLNSSGGTILPGAPLSEASATKVALASADAQAFAVCVSGGANGQVVAWSDAGTVTRKDWSPVAGAAALTPGQTYYLGSTPGTISTTGQQQIGIASSATTLRISIQPPQPVLVQTFVGNTVPSGNLGKLNDLYYDFTRGNLYRRGTNGWEKPAKLALPTIDPRNLPLNIAPTGNGWVTCS